MGNYLETFYNADNALCNMMNSVTYANEIEGVNATSENNKLLGSNGYKYHLSNGQKVELPSYSVKYTGFNSSTSTLYGIGKDGLRVSCHVTNSQMLEAIDAYKGNPVNASHSMIRGAFSVLIKEGLIPTNLSFMHGMVSKQKVSFATISQLVTYEQVRAKASASANSMRAWGAIAQAANTDFSNIKNQAQAGTTQISGWVQTDGDELTAAANMLSSVLQSLASPVTVS